MHAADDLTARRSACAFVLAATLVLAGAGAVSAVADPPATPASVAVSVVTWLLGGAVTMFLGASVVYATVGCLVNLRRPTGTPVRRTT